jgi:hypothetical protein
MNMRTEPSDRAMRKGNFGASSKMGRILILVGRCKTFKDTAT